MSGADNGQHYAHLADIADSVMSSIPREARHQIIQILAQAYQLGREAVDNELQHRVDKAHVERVAGGLLAGRMRRQVFLQRERRIFDVWIEHGLASTLQGQSISKQSVALLKVLTDLGGELPGDRSELPHPDTIRGWISEWRNGRNPHDVD